MPLVTVPLIGNAASSPRSRLLTLDLRGHAFPFVAGQAVVVGRHGDADAKPYSIACSPEHTAASGRLELLIAIDVPGAALLASAEPGALVDIDGPHGTFLFPDTPGDHRLLFVAGGTGIAPLRAMIDHALRRHASHRVSVLYSARRADEFAFIDELRLHALDRRIELHQTVTRDEGAGWQGLRGRIGRREFETVLHEPASTLCFVCGPPSMVAESVAVLRALGVPDALIRTEQW
ncbi:MAG: FAD-binding oxidoreductase [Vicinamibacterales bacterium]